MAEEQKWTGKTYGGSKLLGSLIFALRFMDVRLLYLAAAIFVVPVCLCLNASSLCRSCACRLARPLPRGRHPVALHLGGL